MNKNTAIIVILVIIVLGVAFWAFKSPTKQEPSDSAATVSALSVANVTSPASAVLAGAKTITWQTSNYPAGVGVSINLLRQTGDSPRQFELVRTLASDTANDGQETWVPQSGEKTDDLYIEVTCSSIYQYKAGCSISTDPIKV